MSSRVDRAELLRRYERRLQLMVPADPEYLKVLPLFAGVPEKARHKVVEKVRKYIHLVEFAAGDTILREGDYGDSAYYLVEGAVEVVAPRPCAASGIRPQVRGGAHVSGGPASRVRGPRPRDVGTPRRRAARSSSRTSRREIVPGGRKLLEPGEIFGEISALSRYPVSATVRAESSLKLLQIRLPGLRMLMASSKEFKKFLDSRYRERTLARHLRHVAIFAALDDEVIDRATRRPSSSSFEPGQVDRRGGQARRRLLPGARRLREGERRHGQRRAGRHLPAHAATTPARPRCCSTRPGPSPSRPSSTSSW